MFKITYSINFYYQDQNNYPAIDVVDTDYITGETIDEAMKDLLYDLKRYDKLDGIVNATARIHNDEYLDIEIISVDEIVDSMDDFDFHEHYLFTDLVDKKREEIVKEEKEKTERKNEIIKQKELEELKRLQEKYNK